MNVTCIKCGHVHFAVTREFAENHVIKFNDYYDGLTPYQQHANYGGKKSSIQDYSRCFACGNDDLSAFRPSVDGDCPIGCTTQPIIQEA